MNLEEELARIFRKNGWTWNLKENNPIVPGEEDIAQALDEAARILYDESVGAQLQVGRLIIIKKHLGHDVYIYAGDYE